MTTSDHLPPGVRQSDIDKSLAEVCSGCGEDLTEASMELGQCTECERVIDDEPDPDDWGDDR